MQQERSKMAEKLPKMEEKLPKKTGPPVTPIETADQMRDLVRKGVNRRKADGLKRAMAAFALHVGFSERRMSAYFYGEVRNPLAWEYVQLHNRIKSWMQAEVRRLDAEYHELKSVWDSTQGERDIDMLAKSQAAEQSAEDSKLDVAASKTLATRNKARKVRRDDEPN